MEYNPFAQEYYRLQGLIENRNGEKRRLSDELSWFDATNISSLYSSLEGKENSKNKLQSLIDGIKKEIDALHAKIQETKSHTKTLFNPFNWFDDEQKSYRKKLNGLKEELSAKQDLIERRQKSLSGRDESINKINQDIEKHKNFDRQQVSDEVNSLGKKIVLLEEEFNPVSDLKNKVDIELRPVLKQINDYESNISTAKEKIRKAQSFEQKLDAADNSYERAMIHQECENAFGEGSPKKIIRQQEGLVRKFERDLEKAKNRAVQIGKKASRDIRKIVIDGNNMCYEGNKFVGLAPLIESTTELQKNYTVIIVFDSAIRSQVNANDQMIRARFKNTIKVHVVATAQLADETLLDIASGDDFCYILSNDRFGEYMEKEVVKNSRLIRHEVVDGKVIIHDLNVNVRYG